MIILTDIHGCYDSMIALLDKIPEEEKAKGICICGDMIDRGPKSMQVVQHAIDNNFHVVTGNHEQMMVDWIKNGMHYNDMLWLGNGGMAALDSYKEVAEGEYLKGDLDLKLLVNHALYMDTLPLYIEFPNVKNDDGRYLVISHSNITNVWKYRDTQDEIMRKRFENEVTWGRPNKIKDVAEIYNVIGHTPQKDGPRLRQIYANVDTGCAYKNHPGYGKLTAIQFPEMIIYEQENIDA